MVKFLKRSWYFTTLQTLVLSDTSPGRRGRGKRRGVGGEGGEGEKVGTGRRRGGTGPLQLCFTIYFN